MHKLNNTMACVLSILCFAMAGQAQSVYRVTVDTSAISGTDGYVDFQLNPGSGAQSATVLITRFTNAGGTLAASSISTGAASGTLPGPVVITNSTGFNDNFQEFTFGSNLGFDAEFSGPALFPPPGTTGGSTFALLLYGNDGMTPLLTTDPAGSVLQIQIQPDGTTLAQNFLSTSGGGAPVASAVVMTSSAVPEPSETTVFVVGLIGLFGLRVHTRWRKVRS